MEKTYCVGIDIGSTSAKTIVMDRKGAILFRLLMPTGYSSVETAGSIQESLEKEGFAIRDCVVVATGYGRISVPYAHKSVTEITCHGRGACMVYGIDRMTVIDIGGQDTKIIRMEDGMVADFLMNDKCSAGTGRFLEIMANTLAVHPGKLCEMAAAGGGVSISSMCTVFAESEVTGLIGRGETRENIAFAVVDSIVRKVVSQAGRFGGSSDTFCLTGGLCDFPYLKESLSSGLGATVLAVPDGRYAGAIGAALTGASLRLPDV